MNEDKKKFGDRFKTDPNIRTVPWRAYNGDAQDLTNFSLSKAFSEDMDYEVEQRPIYYYDSNKNLVEIPNRKALVRNKTFDANEYFIDVTTKGYRPLQTREFGDIFDIFSKTEFTQLVSYGAFAEGRDTFALFSVTNGAFDIAGESHDQYLMIYNRHASGMALKVSLVTLRSACINIVQHVTDRATHKVNLAHNQKLVPNAEFVAGTMKDVGKFADNLVSQYRLMANTKFSEGSDTTYFRLLSGVDDTNNVDTYQKSLKLLDDLIEVYANERPNQSIKGTVYELFNVATAYANHMRGRRVQQQLLQPMSSRSQLMRKAYKLCLSMLVL
jgi:hypothetical protein